MKRLAALILTLGIMLCSCTPKTATENTDKTTAPDSKLSGVWVTYSEINSFLADGKYKENINIAIDNLKQNGITDMFFQVHPFCDSLFCSDYFPQNSLASSYGFDVFSYTVKKSHENNIKIHAWINPYRVKSSDTDISDLNPESFAYKCLNDGNAENDKNICITNGIYLNPASDEVKMLIINGVKEILEKYDVDGIHIDDYFYPTTSPDFDKESYTDYCDKTENPLSLGDYRISHINSLISSIYTAVKFKSKDLVFSISPSASIRKNAEEYYADINTWVENGCVDILIPQAYFGFKYPQEEFCFQNIINDYKNLKLGSTKLVIGLATYKIGTDKEPDKAEWQNGNEIIAEQVRICESDNQIDGYVFFSYSSFLRYVNGGT